MICRLVLSLRKATDPNVIRAWNVDHFSTQAETQSQFHHGLEGVLTPIRFHPPTLTVTSGAGSGTKDEERNCTQDPVV